MTGSFALSRRRFLLGTAGLAAVSAAPAAAQTLVADLRGSLDITTLGVRPGALDDQSAAFQSAVNRAARDGLALFMPGGDYTLSNIDLPSGLTLVGVPGRTRLHYGGDGHMLFASDVADIRFDGLTIDGNHRLLADYAPALVHISTGANVVLTDCAILGSAKTGVQFDRVSGSMRHCRISGAREAAFLSNEATGLSLEGNHIHDCADNGILIYRWTEGRDATLISGNRIERIGARSGGTGPYGNAINLFRADDVIVTGNTTKDCDFSGIRCNAASNVQISGNSCMQSGEVAIFVEFGFQGAVVANNIIDEAATGISVTNSNYGGRLAVVQGNLVRNLTGRSLLPTDEPHYGKGIAVETDTLVTSNIIEEAAYCGIGAGWGEYRKNLILSQNIVRQTPMGVAVSVADGVGQTVISGNLFEATPTGAIIGMRWSEQATGELLGADRLPDALAIERNRAIG